MDNIRELYRKLSQGDKAEDKKSLIKRCNDFLKEYLDPVQIMTATAFGALGYASGYLGSLQTDLGNFILTGLLDSPRITYQMSNGGFHFSLVDSINLSNSMAIEVGKRSIPFPAGLGYFVARKFRKTTGKVFGEFYRFLRS